MSPRVVSLVPSATETLLALGADVVAGTKFCEQPELAQVGGTKNPDLAAIDALAPDLVVMDEEENRREDADALRAAGHRLLVTSVRSVGQALTTVADLANATGCDLPEDWPRAMGVGPPVTWSAFVPIWRRPWMSLNADTYGASIVRRLGIEMVTAEEAERYPEVSLDALRPPDLVLVPSEPYDFSDEHLAELADAFPAAAITRIDGRDLFWWGIRTPTAVDRLEATVLP